MIDNPRISRAPSLLLLLASTMFATGAQAAPAAHPKSSQASCDAHLAGATKLTAAHARVVRWVIDRIRRSKTMPHFSAKQVEAATGLKLSAADVRIIYAAVKERVLADATLAKKFSNNRCVEYQACSLHRDLRGANSEVLARYKRDRSEDGRRYRSWRLPEFAAHRLDGALVRSKSLVGRPTLIAFIAGHCTHSYRSLSHLRALQKRYAKKRLKVVGVYVGSGSASDVKSWLPKAFGPPGFAVWVHRSRALGDKIGSRLVPTFLLVDHRGRVRQKLVGEKTAPQLARAVDALLGASHNRTRKDG